MLRSLRAMSRPQRLTLLFALTVGPITFIVTWLIIHRRNLRALVQ